MKYKRFSILTFCCLLFIASSVYSQRATSNSISGFVFDGVSRLPVADVYVELMDDFYSTVRRIKTDGSGRFYFGNLASGNFKVKVLPYAKNYLEEIQDATIINYTFGNVRTSDSVYLDFYLRLDKRKLNIEEFGISGVVFAQEVAQEAKKLYKKGISELENDKETEKGVETLKKALAISPDYYDALNRIGIEYIVRKQYYEALPHLIKAIEINQRSFSSYYAIGIAAYNLKEFTQAAEAFKAAAIIDPQSIYAQFQYGRALRISGNDKDAETALLKAKSLSKDSTIPEIYWQLGLLYNKLNLYDKAADELETYLKVQQDEANKQNVKKLISTLREKAKNKS